MQDRAGGFLKRIMDAHIDLQNVDKMEAEYNMKKELKKNMSRVSVLKGDDSFSVGTRLFRDQSGMTLASYNSLMQPPASHVLRKSNQLAAACACCHDGQYAERPRGKSADFTWVR